jgi:hypothetical protein
MTIQRTQWQPDTCGCILEYTWDDTLPEDTRTHTPVTSKPCSIHANQANTTTVFNTVVDENQRKNLGFQIVLDNGPTTIFDQQADGSRTLKNGITYTWAWTGTAPNRTIVVTLSGISLTQAQKNAIQTKLNAKFGTGKITLG